MGIYTRGRLLRYFQLKATGMKKKISLSYVKMEWKFLERLTWLNTLI